MGIDRDHWGMMLFPDYMESARTTKVMRQEAFVRAVIADEAAKASGAKNPTPGSVRRVDDAVQAVADALGCTFAVDTHNATKTAEGIRELVEAVVALRCNSEPAASAPELDEPQRAEGVPEKRITKDFGEYLAWQSERDPELKDAIDSAKADYEEIQAEIDRRVQEATATANEVSRNNMETIVKLGWESMSLQKKVDELTADRNAARQQLSEARAEIERLNNTVVGKLIADAIQKDRESDERECRREIRRLRAEVERLKARQLPDGWEMSGTLGDNRRRIAELEAEVERLSRPVKWAELDKATHHDSPKYTSLGRVVGRIQCESFIQRERNAREAAESALAELRELVRTHYLMWTAAGASTKWSLLKRIKSCPDADLDAALAKFRKTKEQAK